MNSPDECTRELECDATQEVKEARPVEDSPVEVARGSSGKARSEESLEKHSIVYVKIRKKEY